MVARTAVHFQDVQEKYAPYETLLELTTAEGLNDTSLAASFPLHTATPSASSSRLDEISEDTEDGGAAVQTTHLSQNTSRSYFNPQRHRAERRLEPSPPPATSLRNHTSPKASPVSSPLPSPQKTSISQYLVRDDSGQRSITSLISPSIASSTQYATSEESAQDAQSTASTVETPKATTPTSPVFKPLLVAPAEQPTPPSIPERSSERSSRLTEVRIPTGLPDRPVTERAVTSPPLSETSALSDRPKYEDDPYDFSRFDKPKVKLGPRPVAPGDKAKRPTTASISSIPASFRSIAKKLEPSRPTSQSPSTAAALTPAQMRGLPAPPPIPDVPEYNPRPLSRGSIKSLPSHKSTSMTPDKIRLMKAVELRKKQLRKSNPTPDSFVPPPDEEVPAVPKLPSQSPIEDKAPERPLQVRNVLRDEQQGLPNKADSGISMGYEQNDNREEAKTSETRYTELGQKELVLSSNQHSPRVDTPRITSSHFREPAPESRSAADISGKEYSTGMQTSRNPGTLKALTSGQTTDGVESQYAPTEDTTSVPRIIMADGSRPISAIVKQASAQDSSPVEPDVDRASADEDMSENGELEPPEKNIRRQNSDIAKRRRGFVEPLHLDDNDDFMSDDDFMEELQSATFQEAKPIMVARSPVPHYVPRRPSATSAVSDLSVNSVRAINIGNRASEMPLDFTEAQDRLTPEPTSASRGHSRSASTPPAERSDPISSFRRNVSNGITKRIQAFAERSSIEDSRHESPPTQEVSPNDYGVKDQRELSRSPQPTHTRAGSLRAVSKFSLRGIAANRAPQVESAATWNVQQNPATNVDSVSVSARIIRPNPVDQPESSTETEAELQPSQLVISHKRGTPSQTGVPRLHRIDTNPKPEAYRPSNTTRSSAEGTQPNLLRSPLSPNVDDFPPPPSYRIQASNTAPPNDENMAPKETTRTSRFFKRMSYIGGSKRRSNGPQPVANSSSPVSERTSSTANYASLSGSKDKLELPPALVVGDLNIQFPDSLVSPALV